MKIAVIGAGQVGVALAQGWAQAGHTIVFGVRDQTSDKSVAAARAIPSATFAQVEQARIGADVIVLAVPFPVAISTAQALGPLAGLPLIDCTNPVGPGLTHGLDSARSGSEALQAAVPDARVVKAFSIYGFEVLGDANFGDAGPATMLIAGDDEPALELTSQLTRDLGFEPLPVGGLNAALQLEHMTLLWVRMVRAQGHPAGLAWKRCTR